MAISSYCPEVSQRNLSLRHIDGSAGFERSGEGINSLMEEPGPIDANPPLEEQGPLPAYEGLEHALRRVIREELEPLIRGLQDVRDVLHAEKRSGPGPSTAA